MPNWKKLVVSGSAATLNSLFVQNAVTASVFSGSHIGNLTGTASYVTGSVFNSNNKALSASYAITSSYALFALASAGGTIVQGTGSVTLHTQVTPATTWSFVHNLNNLYPVINVWDPNGFTIIPGGIKSIDVNNVQIYFDTTQAGYASAVVGGTAVSASIAVSSSYAATASYVLGASGVGGSGTTNRLAKFTAATTLGDSNIFDNGSTVQITGSVVIVSGASTAFIVTGSVRSSGGFTGSLFGTASYVTGALFTSANPALSASFATTASFALNGGVTSFNTRIGAVTLQASDISGLAAGIVSSSTFSSPSQGTLRAVINGVQTDVDLGLQTTDNVTFGQVTGSNALFTGTVTAQTLVVQTVTSSVSFITGSTKFGSLISDNHQFTGSVNISGSFSVNGPTSLNTQQNTDVDIGTEVVATVPTASAHGAFFDYVARDGTNFRAGIVMSVWNTTGTVQYNDNSTIDIGDTSGVSLAVVTNGSNAELRATVTTNNWNIKTFVRAI